MVGYFQTQHFTCTYDPHIYSFSRFMVSIPTLELSDTVLVLAKLVLESESCGCVQKFTTVRKSPPLPTLSDVFTSGLCHTSMPEEWCGG